MLKRCVTFDYRCNAPYTRRPKELCIALADWRRQFKTNFDFSTEASLNLADDPELMQLMKTRNSNRFSWISKPPMHGDGEFGIRPISVHDRDADHFGDS